MVEFKEKIEVDIRLIKGKLYFKINYIGGKMKLYV